MAVSKTVARDVTQAKLAKLSAATLQHKPSQEYTVADRIGHASAAFTLSVYGHSDASRDEAAAAAVDAALEA